MKEERLRLAKYGRELEKAGKKNPFKIYEQELIESKVIKTQPKEVKEIKSKGKK